MPILIIHIIKNFEIEYKKYYIYHKYHETGTFNDAIKFDHREVNSFAEN